MRMDVRIGLDLAEEAVPVDLVFGHKMQEAEHRYSHQLLLQLLRVCLRADCVS